MLRIERVEGCMFVNQYLVVKFLGRGACGKVFLCLNTCDLRMYAMKVRGCYKAGSSSAAHACVNIQAVSRWKGTQETWQS